MVVGACAADPGRDDDTFDVSAEPEPVAPAPLDVIEQVAGHFDGHSLTFAPVGDDGALRAQNYALNGTVGLDFSETGPLKFTTTEAIVTNNKNATCTANAAAYPTNTFADGKSHALSDGTLCTNGHLCAIVTIQNTASNYVDRVYTELSAFKPTVFGGDNGAQPYSASNPSGYPAGFGLGATGVAGIWSYGSIGPSETTTKVRWDFALPTCEDFNFLTVVKGSKRVTRYSVSTTTQPFQDACSAAGSTTLSFGVLDTTDVSAPFPLTIYDKPIASLAVGKYGYLHEGKERSGSASESFVASINADFPLSTKMPWAVVPYWSPLAASSVCVATTGTTPNRTFVVTWKYAVIDNFVSAILHETTDQVELQYGGTARCLNALYRGGVSTVGIQGNGSTYKRVNYNNANFLLSTSCLTTPPSGPDGTSVPTVRLNPTPNGLPPNDPFSAGNATTDLKIVTASDYTYSSSDIHVCVKLNVKGTSTTAYPWEVRMDLSLPPFNGQSRFDQLNYTGTTQVNFADAGGGFARIYGKSNGDTAFNPVYNNALLTKLQSLDFAICSYNTPPAISSNTDSSWYTLTYKQGTGNDWTTTHACVTVTAKAVVDSEYFPFDFVWQATLDITAAKKRITDAGKTLNYVSWDPQTGSGYWTSTPTNYYQSVSPLPNSYAILSGTSGGNNGNLNINNYKTQTVTACVNGY